MRLEDVLLVLLFAYVITFLLLGVSKGRKYLKGYSKESNKDYLFHSVDVTLTLAGLAITALALFIGLGFEYLERLSSIITFFSISFVVLTLSAMFTRFPRRIYIFIADILADTGMLSIACGFLAFFWYQPQWFLGSILVYVVFVLVFVILSALDIHKYYRYWSLKNGEIHK